MEKKTQEYLNQSLTEILAVVSVDGNWGSCSLFHSTWVFKLMSQQQILKRLGEIVFL